MRNWIAVAFVALAATACGEGSPSSSFNQYSSPAGPETPGGASPGPTAVASVTATQCTFTADGPDDANQTGTVQTTSDGLQFVDLKVGDGATAQSGQKLSMQYTGWLQSNCQKFDSSRDRGQPFSFTLGQGQVIKGWDEGIVGMKVNGVRKLIIPASLGYGASGQGSIPPNATLVFVVTLVSIG
jgi:peptidylprolyl isomerase